MEADAVVCFSGGDINAIRTRMAISGVSKEDRKKIEEIEQSRIPRFIPDKF